MRAKGERNPSKHLPLSSLQRSLLFYGPFSPRISASFPLSYNERSYSRDRDGLSGENMKRHILAMSQGIDIPKEVSSAPFFDSLLSDDPQFEVFGGETTDPTAPETGSCLGRESWIEKQYPIC